MGAGGEENRWLVAGEGQGVARGPPPAEACSLGRQRVLRKLPSQPLPHTEKAKRAWALADNEPADLLLRGAGEWQAAVPDAGLAEQ